ncbi:hypothetical protein M9H77_07286 [Catharanthus roseus]|uniref:Uncharacterized protein n=1 Tax=Catharanthus roseus TaxID=4058 RepID=A0ACC0BUJ3_CATRO|nr:hypothetical protein M9H77_07286 [Catharanthus roseus]
MMIPEGGREIGNPPKGEFEDDIAELEETENPFHDLVISIRDEMRIVRLSNLEDAYQLALMAEELRGQFAVSLTRNPKGTATGFTRIDRGYSSAPYTANKSSQVRTNTASSSHCFNCGDTGHGYYSCLTRQINLAEVDEEDVYHKEPKYDQFDDETEEQEQPTICHCYNGLKCKDKWKT